MAQDIVIPKDIKTKQESRISERETNGKMMLYTVMIFFGNDKKEAYNIKSKFEDKYKESDARYDSEIKWEEPYFKLYVGKFLNAIEAQKLISELKTWLPNVILVKKEMDYPQL
jgi:hypothetical protein